jgi:hypothetical protein
MDIPETEDLPCQDKLVFDNRRQANVAATVARYRYGIILRPYLCRHCGLWHLTGQTTDAA